MSNSTNPNSLSRSAVLEISPVLRWAGSKKKLVPAILSLAPVTYRRYLEPFVGSGCLFAALAPKKAIIGDINEELMLTYSALRDYPNEVVKAIALFPTDSETYYSLRAILPNSLDTVTRAARFIYLNRFCFNGVYRTNMSGNFNVPRGTRTGAMPSPTTFFHFSDLLKRTKLVKGDFQGLLASGRDGDFVYLDPPYVEPGTRFRGEYGYGSFSTDDEDRLIAALLGAHSRGVSVVLSYHDGLMGRLPGWHEVRQNVARSVGGFGRSRKIVCEVLYTNVPISQSRGHQ